MEFSQIRPILLLASTFINCFFAILLWSKSRNNKNAYYFGWLATFSAIFNFAWASVFFFEADKLFWVKATWLGVFMGSANIIFTYYFTGYTKFFRLKIFFWYVLAALVSVVSFATPLIIQNASNQYPFVTLETAGPLNQAARIFIFCQTLVPLFYMLRFYRRSTGQKKLQVKYFFTGSLIYIGGIFIFNGILPFLFYNIFFSYLDVAVYFSVAWIGLATYAIIKKDLFEIKMVLTELLVALISVILFVQIFLAESLRTKTIGAVIFVLFCLIGYLLIKATNQEVKKEQEAQKLAGALSDLNKTLERKVREKTRELQAGVNELEKSQKALLNILDDIEEARRKIAAEQNKTLAIIANFADGLLVVDNKNFLSLINPQAEIFFDVKAEKVIGRPLAALKEMPAFQPLMKLLGDQSEPLFRKELSLRDLTLEVSVVPIAGKAETIGNLIILHNVTREKLIEKMKTEFVSVAAHQLRTPLAGVKWCLGLLLDGDIGELNAEQKSFIERGYASNERMLLLINDLLNVARIEEGKYVYNLTAAKPADLLRAAFDACQELAANRQIKMTRLEPPAAAPEMTVKVDAEKIIMALQNLIDNAIKYTNPGGEVTVSLKYDTNKIEFSVKDTGVGVNQNQQDRLFTKFFRAANVMLMETDGTGLGLFITKNIVEAHGGRIWFESKEGQGSTFSFSLPANR